MSVIVFYLWKCPIILYEPAHVSSYLRANLVQQKGFLSEQRDRNTGDMSADKHSPAQCDTRH